jgi:hypothetical protein
MVITLKKFSISWKDTNLCAESRKMSGSHLVLFFYLQCQKPENMPHIPVFSFSFNQLSFLSSRRILKSVSEIVPYWDLACTVSQVSFESCQWWIGSLELSILPQRGTRDVVSWGCRRVNRKVCGMSLLTDEFSFYLCHSAAVLFCQIY